MAEKGGNSQNRIVKESIFSALMILMEKKSIKEISITAVAKTAGVSRMAFYRNYSSIEDIIINYLDENFVSYAQLLPPCGKDNCTESIGVFFTYFKNQSTLIRNLINSEMTHLLLESFSHFLHSLSRNIVCDRQLSPAMEKYSTEFIAGGIFNVVLEWAKDDMKESGEAMTEIVSRILAD